MTELKKYLPALAVALILGLILLYFFLPRPGFEPIKLKRFVIADEFDGDLIFHKSDVITILDGLCNTSGQDQDVTITLKAQENTTAFAPRILYFAFDGSPPSPKEASYTITIGANQCLEQTEVLRSRLPALLPQAEWRLAVHIQVMGSKSGQIQRTDRLSNLFKVVD